MRALISENPIILINVESISSQPSADLRKNAITENVKKKGDQKSRVIFFSQDEEALPFEEVGHQTRLR